MIFGLLVRSGITAALLSYQTRLESPAGAGGDCPGVCEGQSIVRDTSSTPLGGATGLTVCTAHVSLVEPNLMNPTSLLNWYWRPQFGGLSSISSTNSAQLTAPQTSPNCYKCWNYKTPTWLFTLQLAAVVYNMQFSREDLSSMNAFVLRPWNTVFSMLSFRWGCKRCTQAQIMHESEIATFVIFPELKHIFTVR